jgi:hypothetical protein
MRTLSEIIIAKIFDNPLGRLYFGVPKGKKIYKITKSSSHYYTGEIAKNGMPVICTGNCRPNGKLAFWKWLETWKPIHLCWFYRRMGWKIPKYLIGADTGFESPSSTGDPSNQWTNPTNAYVSNNNRTYTNTYWAKQSYGGFGFSIPSGATIDGIEYDIEALENPTRGSTLVVGGLSWDAGSHNVTKNTSPLTTSETIKVLGGSTDTWGRTWSDTDFSNTNFRAYIGATASIYDAIQVDHIQVKVYYTEATGTNMKINISDTWKDIDSVLINIGDSWKEVTKIQQNIGDVWKDVF